MNCFKKHIAYLKDNPEGYWFKRKLYGWGWTPATRAGWGVTVLFFVFVAGAAVMYEYFPTRMSDTEFVISLVAAVVLFLTITIKTGEPPRWQWGRHRKE